MNLLVTGGAGFIGSNLIQHIIDRPEITRLINLDCLTYAGHLENLETVAKHPKYIFEKVDIRDKTAVLDVFKRHQITHVMHLAAESHVDRSITGPGDFISTNVVGTFNLLEACRALWPVGRAAPSGESGASGHQVGRAVPCAPPSAGSPRPLSSQPAQPFNHSTSQPLNAPISSHAPETPALSLQPSAFSLSRVSSHPSHVFAHISTDEVYGSLGKTGYFTETTPYAPNSPYSASKASSDMLVRAYHHTYGLPTVITNCSNNYGPYQFPEKLIPVVIQSVLARKPVPVYGDGMNVRDWLYVGDHAEALWQALTRGTPGETYNIGGHNEWANINIVQLICDLIDEMAPQLGGHSRKLITFVKDRPGHDRRYAIDATKIKEQLGWTPAHTFEQGIGLTVRWYLDHQDWVRRVMSR